jgi:hypothetical protein
MCFWLEKYSERGFLTNSEPPLKSSQTSQPELDSCFLATVLKSAFQRVMQKYIKVEISNSSLASKVDISSVYAELLLTEAALRSSGLNPAKLFTAHQN